MCHGIKGSNSFREGNLSLISQHLVQFNLRGSSAGGDVMYLIYHVTLHGHFIEGSLKIYGWELLLLYNNLDKSCGHKYCVRGDMFLICHQTFLEYTFKEVYGFTGGSPSH